LRAVRHHPEAQQLYNGLGDAHKARFRRTWALRKNFEYTKETRLVRTSHTSSSTDSGEYLTRLQLTIRLGGTEHKAALQQAKRYVGKCRALGGRWVKMNDWLGCRQYLFFAHLLSETTSTTWEQTVQGYTVVNEWEHLKMVAAAQRAYAKMHHVRPESVTEEVLAATPQGVKGWAALDEAAPAPRQPAPLPEGAGARAAAPPPAPKARGRKQRKAEEPAAGEGAAPPPSPAPSAGGGGKPAAARTPNLVGAAEKELRTLLADDCRLTRAYANLLKEADEQPEFWSWATQGLSRLSALNQAGPATRGRAS
jgi:hypothetical protein